jgi:hypothetical protein
MSNYRREFSCYSWAESWIYGVIDMASPRPS